jgi:hypothetical protein
VWPLLGSAAAVDDRSAALASGCRFFQAAAASSSAARPESLRRSASANAPGGAGCSAPSRAGRSTVQLSKEGSMSSVQPLIDAAGRRRSPAAMPGFRAGKAPRNKGQRYPADPPTVDQIVAVMRQAQQSRYGHRLNGLIVVLWRAGPRINEALVLTETDLDQRRGSSRQARKERSPARGRHGRVGLGSVAAVTD